MPIAAPVMLSLLRSIFIPSFVYTLFLRANSDFFDEIRRELTDGGAKFITVSKDRMVADLPAKEVFPFPAFGVLRLTVHPEEDKQFEVSVEFRSLRLIFFSTAGPLIVVLLLATAVTQDLSILGAIALLILMGHIAAIGALVGRAAPINRYFDRFGRVD